MDSQITLNRGNNKGLECTLQLYIYIYKIVPTFWQHPTHGYNHNQHATLPSMTRIHAEIYEREGGRKQNMCETSYPRSIKQVIHTYIVRLLNLHRKTIDV